MVMDGASVVEWEPVWFRDFEGKSVFFFKIVKYYVFSVVFLKELCFYKHKKKLRFKFAPVAFSLTRFL